MLLAVQPALSDKVYVKIYHATAGHIDTTTKKECSCSCPDGTKEGDKRKCDCSVTYSYTECKIPGQYQGEGFIEHTSNECDGKPSGEVKNFGKKDYFICKINDEVVYRIYDKGGTKRWEESTTCPASCQKHGSDWERYSDCKALDPNQVDICANTPKSTREQGYFTGRAKFTYIGNNCYNDAFTVPSEWIAVDTKIFSCAMDTSMTVTYKGGSHAYFSNVAMICPADQFSNDPTHNTANVECTYAGWTPTKYVTVSGQNRQCDYEGNHVMTVTASYSGKNWDGTELEDASQTLTNTLYNVNYDVDGTYCQPDTPCFSDTTTGAHDFGIAWNIGGEVAASTCCGDDSNEWYRKCETDEIIKNACDGDNNACCKTRYDCVSNGACTNNGETKDADGDNAQEKCVDGVWQDLPEYADIRIYHETAGLIQTFSSVSCTTSCPSGIAKYDQVEQVCELFYDDDTCQMPGKYKAETTVKHNRPNCDGSAMVSSTTSLIGKHDLFTCTITDQIDYHVYHPNGVQAWHSGDKDCTTSCVNQGGTYKRQHVCASRPTVPEKDICTSRDGYYTGKEELKLTGRDCYNNAFSPNPVWTDKGKEFSCAMETSMTVSYKGGSHTYFSGKTMSCPADQFSHDPTQHSANVECTYAGWTPTKYVSVGGQNRQCDYEGNHVLTTTVSYSGKEWDGQGLGATSDTITNTLYNVNWDGDGTYCKSDTPCFSDTTTGDHDFGIAWNIGGEVTTGDSECCGDDANEWYRRCETDELVDPKSCDGDNKACCSHQTDCVAHNQCRANGWTGDIDSDNDQEYCDSGVWKDISDKVTYYVYHPDGNLAHTSAEKSCAVSCDGSTYMSHCEGYTVDQGTLCTKSSGYYTVRAKVSHYGSSCVTDGNALHHTTSWVEDSKKKAFSCGLSASAKIWFYVGSYYFIKDEAMTCPQTFSYDPSEHDAAIHACAYDAWAPPAGTFVNVGGQNRYCQKEGDYITKVEYTFSGKNWDGSNLHSPATHLKETLTHTQYNVNWDGSSDIYCKPDTPCFSDTTTGAKDKGIAWNIGGEVAASNCCGDDSNEWYRFCETAETIKNACNGDNFACCNSASDCVAYGACTNNGGTKDADSDNAQEKCVDGVWKDLPEYADIRIYHETAGLIQTFSSVSCTTSCPSGIAKYDQVEQVCELFYDDDTCQMPGKYKAETTVKHNRPNCDGSAMVSSTTSLIGKHDLFTCTITDQIDYHVYHPNGVQAWHSGDKDCTTSCVNQGGTYKRQHVCASRPTVPEKDICTSRDGYYTGKEELKLTGRDCYNNAFSPNPVWTDKGKEFSCAMETSMTVSYKGGSHTYFSGKTMSCPADQFSHDTTQYSANVECTYTGWTPTKYVTVSGQNRQCDYEGNHVLTVTLSYSGKEWDGQGLGVTSDTITNTLYNANWDGDSGNYCNTICFDDKTTGAHDNGIAWNIGGETAASTCCGDDANEWYRTCENNDDEKTNSTNACTSGWDNKACCSTRYDCVAKGSCYNNGWEGDPDGDGTIEVCEDGAWVLRRDSVTYSILDPGGTVVFKETKSCRVSCSGNDRVESCDASRVTGPCNKEGTYRVRAVFKYEGKSCAGANFHTNTETFEQDLYWCSPAEYTVSTFEYTDTNLATPKETIKGWTVLESCGRTSCAGVQFSQSCTMSWNDVATGHCSKEKTYGVDVRFKFNKNCGKESPSPYKTGWQKMYSVNFDNFGDVNYDPNTDNGANGGRTADPDRYCSSKCFTDSTKPATYPQDRGIGWALGGGTVTVHTDGSPYKIAYNDNGSPSADRCCGDDANEYYLECTSGEDENKACDVSSGNDACCPEATDCVFDDKCHPNELLYDIDKDNAKEFCRAGKWVDVANVIPYIYMWNQDEQVFKGQPASDQMGCNDLECGQEFEGKKTMCWYNDTEDELVCRFHSKESGDSCFTECKKQFNDCSVSGWYYGFVKFKYSIPGQGETITYCCDNEGKELGISTDPVCPSTCDNDNTNNRKGCSNSNSCQNHYYCGYDMDATFSFSKPDSGVVREDKPMTCTHDGKGLNEARTSHRITGTKFGQETCTYPLTYDHVNGQSGGIDITSETTTLTAHTKDREVLPDNIEWCDEEGDYTFKMVWQYYGEKRAMDGVTLLKKSGRNRYFDDTPTSDDTTLADADQSNTINVDPMYHVDYDNIGASNTAVMNDKPSGVDRRYCDLRCFADATEDTDDRDQGILWNTGQGNSTNKDKNEKVPGGDDRWSRNRCCGDDKNEWLLRSEGADGTSDQRVPNDNVDRLAGKGYYLACCANKGDCVANGTCYPNDKDDGRGTCVLLGSCSGTDSDSGKGKGGDLSFDACHCLSWRAREYDDTSYKDHSFFGDSVERKFVMKLVDDGGGNESPAGAEPPCCGDDADNDGDLIDRFFYYDDARDYCHYCEDGVNKTTDTDSTNYNEYFGVDSREAKDCDGAGDVEIEGYHKINNVQYDYTITCNFWSKKDPETGSDWSRATDCDSRGCHQEPVEPQEAEHRQRCTWLKLDEALADDNDRFSHNQELKDGKPISIDVPTRGWCLDNNTHTCYSAFNKDTGAYWDICSEETTDENGDGEKDAYDGFDWTSESCPYPGTVDAPTLMCYYHEDALFNEDEGQTDDIDGGFYTCTNTGCQILSSTLGYERELCHPRDGPIPAISVKDIKVRKQTLPGGKKEVKIAFTVFTSSYLQRHGGAAERCSNCTASLSYKNIEKECTHQGSGVFLCDVSGMVTNEPRPVMTITATLPMCYFCTQEAAPSCDYEGTPSPEKGICMLHTDAHYQTVFSFEKFVKLEVRKMSGNADIVETTMTTFVGEPFLLGAHVTNYWTQPMNLVLKLHKEEMWSTFEEEAFTLFPGESITIPIEINPYKLTSAGLIEIYVMDADSLERLNEKQFFVRVVFAAGSAFMATAPGVGAVDVALLLALAGLFLARKGRRHGAGPGGREV